MITDLLLILLAFILGYGVFIATAYLLVKMMLPKIEDGEEFTFTKSEDRQLHRNVKKRGYLAS